MSPLIKVIPDLKGATRKKKNPNNKINNTTTNHKKSHIRHSRNRPTLSNEEAKEAHKPSFLHSITEISQSQLPNPVKFDSPPMLLLRNDGSVVCRRLLKLFPDLNKATRKKKIQIRISIRLHQPIHSKINL